MDLKELQENASKCTLCSLSKDRQVPVFAKGNPLSDIMICGMCPGPDENSLDNELGRPFIGRAGKLLDKILEDSELTHEEVYITNVVKCFLKPGIKLQSDWIDACSPYLINQIADVKPKVILALGADAGRAILNKPYNTSLSSMRGKEHKFTSTISIIVTYHPSYFLRKGGQKHEHYPRILDDIEWVKDVISRN